MTLELILARCNDLDIKAQIAQYAKADDIELNHFEATDWDAVNALFAATVEIVADDENNAETWWDAMRSEYPELAAALEGGSAHVSIDALARMETLPGWTNGGAGGAYPVRVA